MEPTPTDGVIYVQIDISRQRSDIPTFTPRYQVIPVDKPPSVANVAVGSIILCQFQVIVARKKATYPARR